MENEVVGGYNNDLGVHLQLAGLLKQVVSSF